MYRNLTSSISQPRITPESTGIAKEAPFVIRPAVRRNLSIAGITLHWITPNIDARARNGQGLGNIPGPGHTWHMKGPLCTQQPARLTAPRWSRYLIVYVEPDRRLVDRQSRTIGHCLFKTNSLSGNLNQDRRKWAHSYRGVLDQ
jgi:hypothetical protein